MGHPSRQRLRPGRLLRQSRRATVGLLRSECPFCVALGWCFAPGLLASGYHTPLDCMALRPSPFGACHLSLIGLLASVGRLSMTTRTYTPSLSLSIATYSTCDSVWLGDDAFLPLLPTFDDQSPAVGQRSLPSTWEAGVDVSHEMCYYLTYLDTQLSRFSVVNDHPILAAHPPYHRYGFERTGRTPRCTRPRLGSGC